MITPRETRLHRVADLRGYQEAIVRLALLQPPARASACAVIVPTTAAAAQLRRTIETVALEAPSIAVALPDLLTRDGFYNALAARTGRAPDRAGAAEREVLLRAAARDAVDAGSPPPFDLRPRLLAPILALYDALARQHRTLDAFERLMLAELEPGAAIDRGAERLLAQTKFLLAAYRAYEARLQAAGLVDEHGLRRFLLQAKFVRPYLQVVVTLPDQTASTRGLWTADFDLLTRLPQLERIDVVVTERALASGLHERLHDLLPGVEEVREGRPQATPPSLVIPAGGDGARFTTRRDREEELFAVARAVKLEATGSLSRRIGVVFQQPLPYLYPARQIFDAAGVPYEAFDALPLAAEPYAAASDTVLACAIAGAAPDASAELLRSPHLSFESRDAMLTALAPLMSPAPASQHLRALAALLQAHERLPQGDDAVSVRHRRARAGTRMILDALAAAHERHDDPPGPIDEVAAELRRWFESETFTPRTGEGGVQLIDAEAARYGVFDELRLVGVAEGEWPEPSYRNVFYPAFLLAPLGWPKEIDRRRAARAAFLDLLWLPRDRVAVSTFALEADALASPSSLLEDLDDIELPVEAEDARDEVRTFPHESLLRPPLWDASLSTGARVWLALRTSRAPAEDDRFHGAAGARARRAYPVRAIEQYLECPFKYFAARVLGLEEEPAVDATLTPLERGRFIHEVFRDFFDVWSRTGHRTITDATFAEALRRFEEVTDRLVAALPAADRVLERLRLLGSPVAAGLGERVLRQEAERGAPVVERLLEHQLSGPVRFAAGDRSMTVAIKGVADRIDLLGDGTVHVLDYKLGRPPKPSRALQVPVYGLAAEQHLSAARGRRWTFTDGGYLAFGERDVFVPVITPDARGREALEQSQQRLMDAVEALERGAFPPRPDERGLCETCPFPQVCRKDYVER